MSEKMLQKFLEEIKDVKDEIKDMKEDISAIKVVALETNKIVDRIESTQESHEQTLDLLSRRSIDQEAQIRRIK